jgi:DNA topoisomerase-2
VDKLKQQMVNKKQEHDDLRELDEKDLWCRDLDAFAQEWENQLKEDAEYEKDIRSKGRRASRKIGAGRTTKGRAKKEDEDFNPSKSKAPKSSQTKGVAKVEQKPHKGFLEMFQAKPKPKPKSGAGSDEAEGSGMSDDDFAALVKTSRAPSEQPAPAINRGQRAAAAAPKKWIEEFDEESESDDGKFLGDVGDMVKGINGGETSSTGAKTGRLSLFAMSRPGTSHGEGPSSSSDVPKHTLKSKPSRAFDLSDADETNYELLAKPSPQKAAPAVKKTINSFLSDDDEPVPISKASVKAAPTKAPAKRGPKPKQPLMAKKAPPAPAAQAKPKPVALSPAAKAYAAKQNKAQASKAALSDDEDEEMEDDESPPPRPGPRGRPGRAAVAKAKKPVYIDLDDDDDDDMSGVVQDESEEDDFDEDSD